MKYLVVRFSSIGDIVLTTPVVRSIKAHSKLHEVHYLTKQKFSSLLKANPYIDKLYGIEKNLSEVLPDLKKQQYDMIFDLHHNLRTLELKLKLRKPSYALNKVNVPKWVMVRFKKDILPKNHIVDRYLEVINSAGIPSDGKGLDYFIPQTDRVDSSLLPKEFHEGYTALAIGGTYKTKRLPEQKLIELCEKIKGHIFVIGGPEDKEVAEKLKLKLGERLYNGCGLFSINGSANIIEKAGKVITHDTGMMHIAAAFNKKIYAIWGNTIPAFGMEAYKANAKSKNFEVKGLSCRPCSKLGFNSCPKGHFKCMQDQNINLISKSINE